eukprot:TRINITY_DN884_c0_g4_i3.p1 TRINITY_DN884_c0_g4~~TRINITY_DN884_c0_g4_i3.p1  ORF type:complete len:393 (-),score=157.26 TRINITY_DN884_c0_g4_i3:41-1219(-)
MSNKVKLINIEKINHEPVKPIETKYGYEEVNEHVALAEFKWGTIKEESLCCIDGRQTKALLGTPGGDFIEFANALEQYSKITKQQITQEFVYNQLKQFLKQNDICSKERKFYLHSDFGRIQDMFSRIQLKTNKLISLFPQSKPPSHHIDIWLDELSNPESQGCGHLRLAMQHAQLYCFSDDSILKFLLRAFFSLYWNIYDDPDVDDSNLRSKLLFEIVLGPLQAKAIIVLSQQHNHHNHNHNHNHSFTKYPMLTPNVQGSQVFVYTPDAAIEWRSLILSKYFTQKINNNNNNNNCQCSPLIDYSTFSQQLNDVAQQQLNQTLQLLSPATGVDLYSVQLHSNLSPSDFSNGQSTLQHLIHNEISYESLSESSSKPNLLETAFSYVNYFLDHYF